MTGSPVPLEGMARHLECRPTSGACSVPHMPIFVRPATPADLEEVVALAVRAWEPVHASMATVLGEHLNARIYPDWAASQATDVTNVFTDPHLQVSLAIDTGRIVGFVAVAIDAADNTGEIDMIAVDPSIQRRGVGHKLTQHAMRQMLEAGCDLAVIATGGDDGHTPARALYESEGFTPLPSCATTATCSLTGPERRRPMHAMPRSGAFCLTIGGRRKITSVVGRRPKSAVECRREQGPRRRGRDGRWTDTCVQDQRRGSSEMTEGAGIRRLHHGSGGRT